MQKTLKHTRANRVSPATVELLIRERNNGKSLRQLGQMFGRSHEAVRQVLAKYSPSQVRLLLENTVAAKLGYPVNWLIQLRKEGIINPIKPGGYWLYSEEQVRQIPSLIAERRKCERCGKPRPLGYPRFCRECSQYRKKHKYMTLSPEQKAEHVKRCLAWQRANPERWREILSRAYRKHHPAKVQGILSGVNGQQMAERRDSKGRFTKGNVLQNKRPDSNQREITFTCKFCGKRKPVEEMEVVRRFFPPLPCCRDCWKLLGQSGQSMPTLTGTKAQLSRCPKCGKPLKLNMSRFSATCECGFSATYGRLPNGKYFLVWVDKASRGSSGNHYGKK